MSIPKSRMPGLAIGLFLAAAAPAFAAVTITETNLESITVEMESAPVPAVLESLRERFGFELEGAEHAAGGEPLTLTLTGTLKEVLGRILRNWNYVIVSSPDEALRVAKVVIVNATYGTAPPASAGAAAKDAQMNQITGE